MSRRAQSSRISSPAGRSGRKAAPGGWRAGDSCDTERTEALSHRGVVFNNFREKRSSVDYKMKASLRMEAVGQQGGV